MAITISTKNTISVLSVIVWITLIGLCFEAGSIIFNAIFAARIAESGGTSYWQTADLSSLLKYDRGWFLVISFLMTLVAVLKALMFFLIVRLLQKGKLDFAKPFSIEVRWAMLNVAFIAIGIAIFISIGVKYTGWLASKGVNMPNIQELQFGGADVWLFMAAILIVIAQMFKRGIEIQTENDLTV